MITNLTNKTIHYLKDNGQTAACYPLIGWSLFYLCIAVFSLVGHALNAITVFRHRRQLHCTPYILLLNLGVSDVLFSSAMSLGVLGISSTRTCNGLAVMQAVSRIAFISSLLSSVCLAVDRYIAIRYCMLYNNILTNTVTYKLVFTVWVFSIALCLLMFIEDGFPNIYGLKMYLSFNYVVVVLTISSSVFIIVCLCYVHRISRTQLIRIQRITRHLHGHQANQYFIVKKRIQLNRDVLIVSTFSVVALLPVISVYLKIIIRRSINDHNLLIGAWTMAVIYTAVNPFVYMRSLRMLRNFLVEDFVRFRRNLIPSIGRTKEDIFAQAEYSRSVVNGEISLVCGKYRETLSTDNGRQNTIEL